MTKREAMRLTHQENALLSLGFTHDEAAKLRRISMTLHRWHELECGTDGGCIERREGDDSRPWWTSAHSGQMKYRIPDREKGALKRLNYIVHSRNCRVTVGSNGEGPADLSYYIQTDPRGAALYIIRPGDVPQGEDVSAYYSRGICVY